jgi:lysophospholipase L1-like esterase
MKPLLKHLLFCAALLLSLVPLGCPLRVRVAEPAKEPLPVTVFRNLQTGKKQTVVVYGTSLTINGAWTKGLSDYFEKEFPGQVTLFNGAKAGMTSDWGIQNLQERVLSKNPGLVFIEFSMNDAATKNNISLEKSKASLDNMVNTLRKQNTEMDIVLQTMDIAWDPPKTPEKKYGSERPHLNEYYEVYRRYAREHNLPLVDNYPNWLRLQKDKPEEYQKMVSDGIHPHSGPSMSVTWPAIKALLEKARSAAAIGH